MARGAVRLVTRTLVLWLLSEGPLHGYRIKRALDDPALAFWFPVEFGSVYTALRTLLRAGSVRAAATERDGRRPARTVYAITRLGRRHFAELLHGAWASLPPTNDPIHVALAARSDVDEGEIDFLLEGRLGALEARLDRLRALAPTAPAPEMVDRLTALTRADLAWTRRLLAAERRASPPAARRTPR